MKTSMKTSSSNSWWREMGAISRGMMFIEGAIATPATLDRTEQAGQIRVSASQRDDRRDPISPNLRSKARHLYRDLLFLGGRPMTAGHNDDIEEPFPQTGFDLAESQPRRHGLGGPHRHPAPQSQSQSCATC